MIYRTLRFYFRLAMAVFFRSTEVEGREHVRPSGPLLLVSNHTNALVDPLAILVALDRTISLTAKGTLARNPLLALLMKAAHVIPFHRSQDVGKGADPSKNVDSMAECRRRLEVGAAICIFPEGESHSDPQLRPFKTGAARIALDFLHVGGDPGGLEIVPVGLYFHKKDRFRSRVWVGFGEPIRISEWVAAYPGADPAELTKEIQSRVRALTLNFERTAESDLFTWTAELLATGGEAPAMLGRASETVLARRLSFAKRLQVGYAELVVAHADMLRDLEGRVTAYRERLEFLGVRAHEVYLPMRVGRAAFFVLRELEFALIGLPLALWGLLNHALPLAVVYSVARKVSKDEDHFASNVVFLSLPVFALSYALQIGLALAWLPPVWQLAYIVMLPYSGAYALAFRDRAGSVRQRSRTFVRFLLERGLQRELADRGRSIIADIRRLEHLSTG